MLTLWRTVAKVAFTPRARRDMRKALAYTRKRFGMRKYQEYRELIRQATSDLRHDPFSGVHRPQVHETAWAYHLGKGTRHLFLYRVTHTNRVEIVRFLYDGMDLRRHFPP